MRIGQTGMPTLSFGTTTKIQDIESVVTQQIFSEEPDTTAMDSISELRGKLKNDKYGVTREFVIAVKKPTNKQVKVFGYLGELNEGGYKNGVSVSESAESLSKINFGELYETALDELNNKIAHDEEKDQKVADINQREDKEKAFFASFRSQKPGLLDSLRKK